MAKKDFSDFDFGGMSLFDFMPDVKPVEEAPKASEKEDDALETSSDADTAAEMSDSDDSLSDDDAEGVDDTSLDESTDTSKAATSKPATKDKTSPPKKSKDIKGDDKITLPITCYGRNWVHTVNDIGTITYNELAKLLYNEGYKEVGHSQTVMLSGNGFVLFTLPMQESDTDNLVSITKDTEVVVADGMLQMSVGADYFTDLSAEEISVLHLQEAWEQSAPEWKNKGLNFDPASQVAIPICDDLVSGKTEMELPITVIVNGEEVSIAEEHFLLKDKVLAEDVVKLLATEVSGLCDYDFVSICDISLCKRNDNVYMLHYKENKKSKKVAYSKNFAQIGKAGIQKAVELISLPVNVYFVTLNMTFEITPEMFNGKSKVKEEDVVNVLKQSYSILRSKDRKIETVYAKENNMLSVALVSGTKGSAYALPEAAECGLFKLLRSVAEVNEVKKLDSFLGLFCPDDGPSQRLEVTPTGTFIGVRGTGRESYLIKDVAWESKLPKIPKALFDTIVADFTAHSDIERILRVYWDSDNKSYQLVAPLMDDTCAGKAFIHYRFPVLPRNMQLVLTVHSHNTMPAYFSATDNADEAITGIYGVVGTVDKTPTYKFRIGMEGVFSDITFNMLFE